MRRRNGMPLEIRLAHHKGPGEFLERQTCVTCGCLVPRGTDRAYCLDHSEYAQKVIRELAILEAAEREARRKRTPARRAA